jgi:hypothetical protein
MHVFPEARAAAVQSVSRILSRSAQLAQHSVRIATGRAAFRECAEDGTSGKPEMPPRFAPATAAGAKCRIIRMPPSLRLISEYGLNAFEGYGGFRCPADAWRQGPIR